MSASKTSLLAEVWRGDAVESTHAGHVAVVDSQGNLLFSVGDAEHPTYPRSSLKPLQALAGVAAGTAVRFGFTPGEIAVTCASHAAEPRHRAAVASILAKIGATEADLHCGPHPVGHLPTRDALIREGREPTPIFSNCSGKHAGMLALATLLGAPRAGYWEYGHPVQRQIRAVLAATAGVDREPGWGIDGCGVPTYLLSLRELALGFARLADPGLLPAASAAAARTVTSAMMAEPGLVRGEGGLDTVVMEALPGRVFCKGGAEGCEAAGIPGRGIGIAIKCEDGSPRPLGPVLFALLRRLGVVGEPPPGLREIARTTVLNTRGERVGEVRAVV